jgi:PAS domain S-box-containing protein
MTSHRMGTKAWVADDLVSPSSFDELEQIYLNAPIGLAVFNRELRFVRINRRMADINGASIDAHLGRTVREMVPDLSEQAEALLWNILDSGAPLRDVEVVGETPARPGVQCTWVEQWSPVFHDGKVVGVSVVAQDVTDRKAAETAARESATQFRLIDKNMLAGQFWWDLATGLVTLPKHIAEILEVGEGVVHADRLFEKMHPDDLPAVKASVERAFDPNGDGTMRAAYRIQRSDGSVRWLDSTGQAQFETRSDGSSRPVRAFGVIWDVTEYKLLLETLEEADQRKDVFLATLAHELRNPLAPLRTCLKLLKREPLSARGNQAVAISERQVRQLTRLVDDLLEVSRIAGGKIELRPEQVMLQQVICNVAESIATSIEEHGHQLLLTLPQRPVWIETDPVRIVQIIENLLTNACKYTDHGGTIEVRVRSDESGVVIEVSDTGIGIAPQHLGEVFRMFSQVPVSLDRAAGGLGIGLALAKQLVEMQAGRITVASDGPGKGSTFTVSLPRPMIAAGDSYHAPTQADGAALQAEPHPQPLLHRQRRSRPGRPLE